jgi:hypothetical protein
MKSMLHSLIASMCGYRVVDGPWLKREDQHHVVAPERPHRHTLDKIINHYQSFADWGRKHLRCTCVSQMSHIERWSCLVGYGKRYKGALSMGLFQLQVLG